MKRKFTKDLKIEAKDIKSSHKVKQSKPKSEEFTEDLSGISFNELSSMGFW